MQASMGMVGVAGLEPAAKPRIATAWPCGGWPHSLPAAPEPLGDATHEAAGSSSNKTKPAEADFVFLVGVAGLEPAASWSRTMRDTKLRHTPIIKTNLL